MLFIFKLLQQSIFCTFLYQKIEKCATQKSIVFFSQYTTWTYLLTRYEICIRIPHDVKIVLFNLRVCSFYTLNRILICFYTEIRISSFCVSEGQTNKQFSKHKLNLKSIFVHEMVDNDNVWIYLFINNGFFLFYNYDEQRRKKQHVSKDHWLGNYFV